MRRSPTETDAAEIHAFLLCLLDVRKVHPSTHDAYAAALHLLYSVTLDRPEQVRELCRRKVPHAQPDVLSRTEVARLLGAARAVKHRAIFTLLYGAGLRVSEACALQVTDIDSARRAPCS